MQIAIVRTTNFNSRILPVLQAHAKINNQPLCDYIRAVIYHGFGYQPKVNANAGFHAMENLMNRNNQRSFFVGIDQAFYYNYNIPGNMKKVNDILAQAAGCGQL